MIKDDTAVVVDYKFGRENDNYKEQVKGYMNLLKEIGYAKVKGFLWYVYKNYIKEV
jgi:CRISPR/Cas system-associated exonuclease Cas4 (RecB family)